MWISKPNSFELHPLSIPPLSDRVLQTIVYMSLLPFFERQEDLHSFGFRLKRSALQSVTMLAYQLKNIGNVKSYRGLLKNVMYEKYLSHVRLRYCSRSSLQN